MKPFIRIFCALILICTVSGGTALAQTGTAEEGITSPSDVDSKYSGLYINSVTVTGPTTTDEQLVLDVLPVKPGDPYSPQLVQRAVKYLEKWGFFESIDVTMRKSAGGIDLNFILKDATIVTQINIAGNYPYIENKVRKYLTLNVGDVYTPAKVDDQINRLLNFYKREGYVETQISVSEVEGESDYTVELTFHIHKGKLLRYRNIVIEGNKAYPDGRFISEINTYQPYSEKRLRKSIRNLRNFYHMHGYPRAKIRVKKKTIDMLNQRVDLTLLVKEGPRVDVVFKGNTHVSNARLKKIITIYREGSFDLYEIEISADAITKYYLRRGYPDVKVTTERQKIRDGLFVIRFNIDEGESRYIRDIKFEGNEGVSSKKLQTGMKTKRHAIGQPGALLEGNAEEDSKTITKNFKKEGFLDARVEPWDVSLTKQGFAYDVTIPVDEGPQTLVGEVEFIGNQSATNEDLLKVLKLQPGLPFNPLLLEEELENVKRYYADNGHPYAEVTQETRIDKSANTADIIYEIAEGIEVRIGQIVIVGDVLTSQKAIKGAMSLKEGDPFSYKKLVDSQLNIRRLGAFSSVKIETLGIEDKQPTVHLKVSVNEERPFRIDLEMGYSTRDSFIGSLIFTNINSFGWAKKTFLKLTGGKKLSRAELGWRDPRFLSSSFEMSTIGWIQYRERPTFTYTQLGGSMGFYRRFERLGVLLLQEFTRNYFVKGDSVAADAESLRNTTLSRTSMSASYDARDSFADPTRGYYALGRIAFFNEIRGNDAHFVLFTINAEYDYGFWKRLVFSSAGRFDDIETIGSNVSVPTNELLYLGGADTVRGYAEDSLGPTNALGQATGGRVRWIINEELRLRIVKSFQLAAFFDVGSLTNSFSQMGTNSVRMSAGTGIRYITPVGPLRLDWGFPIDRRANESKSRVHFTFGYVF